METAEEEFFKKRRNLIVSALLVAFLNVAGAERKTFNLLGNEVAFSNPSVIPTTLGIMLTYFVIRYFQYAHDVKDKGIKERFLVKARMHIAPYLKKREFHRSDSDLAKDFESLDEFEVNDISIFERSIPPSTAHISFIHKTGGAILEHRVSVSNWELIIPFLISATYVTFRTRVVTDYVLPVIIAAAAYSTYIPTFRKWAF